MDNDLMKILVCPSCRACLSFDLKSFFCIRCHQYYQIIDGIPVLLDVNHQCLELQEGKGMRE